MAVVISDLPGEIHNKWMRDESRIRLEIVKSAKKQRWGHGLTQLVYHLN
jgi:hypothetical protein